MKLFTVLAVGLAGSVSAAKYMEVDALAAQGMVNLRRYVADNGYPSPRTCTLKNASVRKEW
jgi:tyrosinase